MIYLFMAIDKMQKAEEKETIAQTFNLILHELQNKPNEDLVVNVVNTFLHVVLTNIRPVRIMDRFLAQNYRYFYAKMNNFIY